MPGVEASPAPDEIERRLNEVDALRRRVLNVIPHALRTPITTFRGLAEALEHANEEEIRTQIGPALRRLAAQAENLLDDMLLAAGLTTTLPTGEPQPTAVVPAVHEAWERTADPRPLDVQVQVEVEVERDERDERDGTEATVLAPPTSLAKILLHLLDNAAKYGEGPPAVRVRGDGRRVVITVDSPGAAIGDVDILAEPFFRGEGAVMQSAGLGVGLTVARALAEHAGGSLRVEARDGGGLVATVELAAA
ncbi:MAG TPA: HAMP domain-containing sensor histidine kinase [Acidimicrobiales bacterium]